MNRIDLRKAMLDDNNFRMKMMVIFLMLLCIQISASVCHAQVNDWKNYLSKAWVRNIVVDGDKLYLGTDGGLAIYDKNTGRCQFLDRTNGLADNNIVGLAHHNGKWWIGGKYTGMSIYDENSFQNWQFPFALQSCFAFDDALDKVYIGAIHDIYILKDNYYTVYTPDPKADIHYYPAIQSLVLDKNGTLWFGGFTFGFLSSNGNTTLLNCGASEVNNIIIDDKDNKWLATNRGLIKYDGTSFTSYNTSGGQLSSNNVNGLAFDTNRNLWMGNWNVLVKYDGKQFSSYPLPSNYSNDWICDIAPDGNDVWVATRFHGLLRFYDGTFEQTELEKNILTQNRMHEVSTADEKGNVCFASNDYLAQYTEKGEWKHLFPNAKDYYPAINAAAYDKRGRLWVAPNNSDTILAVIENADTTVFKRDNTPFQTGQLKQLEFDSKNHLWVGASNGLYKYDGVQWSQYNSSNSPMPGDMITSLAFDKSDRLWVGIADLGVCSFDGHNWVCHDTINSPIPYNYVDCIAVDSHNRVWMNSRYSRNGTPVMGKDYGGGLVCYDGTNWKIYNQYNSNIGGNCIVDIAIDKHDALWMAVSDIGLVRFDGENQWDAYTIYNSGLANPWPIQVQIDVKRDMIWLSYEASGGISSAKMNQGTGVEGIFVTPNGAKAIYTIEGRKVKAMTPGQIYIMRDENGKTTKVLAR